MRATYAALSYGAGDYPVHESNLPEVDAQPLIDKVLAQMSRLSGGFALDQPDHVQITIVGNGYTVRLETD